MKIALPTRDGQIDSHFGHCAYYTIFTIENGQIVADAQNAQPHFCCSDSPFSIVAFSTGRLS